MKKRSSEFFHLKDFLEMRLCQRKRPGFFSALVFLEVERCIQNFSMGKIEDFCRSLLQI
jgi:hypothetical protein